MREYREPDADNARWNGFEFRPDDIVIAVPSKSGTTWTQLLVALLVFDGPDFPAPIGTISLWMDQKTRSVEEAHATLAAQRHRRFIKTHTPLDGVPLVDGVRYVCVGRDPRDAAVSMLHHSDNLDREVFNRLIGVDDPEPRPERTLGERLDIWLDGGDFPDWSARFLAHHYQTFWDHKDQPGVALFHFDDYRRNLPGEILRLADHLNIEITPARAVELAEEAGIDRVRDRAADVAPEAHLGLWKDTNRFFRSGKSGEWREVFTDDQKQRYEDLMRGLLEPHLYRWVHGGFGS